jgi:4-oxalocrotonate tautomerase
MPVVTIAMFDGRSIEQKRELVKGVTEVVARVTGNPADAVHVIIDEIKRENWSIGGVLSTDRQAARQAR